LVIYGPDGSIATFDPKTNKLHANLLSVSVAKHHRVPPNAEALRGSALHHRIQSTVSVNRRLIGDGRTKATFDLTFLVI
jgi:hypothetical protein